MKERTLADIVENFYRRGSETAYVRKCGYRNMRWSYRRVAESIYQLAGELESRGVHQGERVFLWGEDCVEWVIAFLGCVLRGAVVVPMDRAASLEFAQRVCRQVDVRLCICSRRQPAIDPCLPVLTFEQLAETLKPHPPNPPPGLDIKAQDAVEIVFTSGTTADPKGVVLSHKNILTNLDPIEIEIGKYLRYEQLFHPLRFLNLLPLSHVFGQFLGLFIPQILGGVVIFQDTLNPTEIIRTIKRERVSVLVTVPRIMETLRDKIERDLESKGKLNGFRKKFRESEGRHFIKRWWIFKRLHNQFGWKFWAFISGGANLGVETEQFWGRLGFAVVQGYGLTETTSLISLNHPMKIGKGSIGRVLPGRELKLAPDGEILVRGESIAKSYFQGKGMQPVCAEEGWFHTGDIGEIDDKGNLYFKGRRKNVLVSPEGMNIYPEDLEKALRFQPGVRDCVVIGLERDGNAKPCAVLLLAKDCNPEPAVRGANAALAEYQHIQSWLVWPDEDFPRTSTQKPQIQHIQEFVNSKLSGAAQQAGGGMLVDLIARITGRNVEWISQDSNLIKDLNLSSIERVELLSALEDRFQLDINESRFTSASTVGDLEQMLSRPAQHRTDFTYPRWAQRAPVALLRLLVYYLLSWPATRLMSWPRIQGRENLKNFRGPLLLICNHVTQVDVGFVLAALPMRFRHRLAVAMLGEMLQEMKHPPSGMSFIQRSIEKISYGLVTALFNVFPLPQQTGFRESFAFAGESADRGYSILVFPEGRRTKDGPMSPFRAGIGLLAMNLKLPVVPIRIDGLFELQKAGKKFSRPGSVTVTIGPALRFDSETDPLKIAEILVTNMERLRKG